MENKSSKSYLFMSTTKGFSLIEAMLFLIITGFFLVGVLGLIPVFMKQAEIQNQEARYDTVRSALFTFISRDLDDDPATIGSLSRYPCPAPLNTTQDSPNFGVEQRDPDNGQCIATTDGINGVFDVGGAYIGAVPTTSLRIPSVNMLDAHNNRFTYAVSKDLVLDQALNDPSLDGSIVIRRASGVEIPNAPFALISHGELGQGAFSAEGGQVLPCQTEDLGESTEDSENCDFNDAVFLEAELSTGTIANFYDDQLAFTLVDEDDDEFWTNIPGSIDDITNKNVGIVCVGTDCNPALSTPDTVLIASGDLLATQDVLSLRDLSARRGLIVGGVTGDPETIGTGTIVAGAGDIDVPTKEGSIAAENDIEAGGYLRPGTPEDSECKEDTIGALRRLEARLQICDGAKWIDVGGGSLSIDYDECVKSNQLQVFEGSKPPNGKLKSQFGTTSTIARPVALSTGLFNNSFCPDQFVLVGLASMAHDDNREDTSGLDFTTRVNHGFCCRIR